MSTPNLRTTLSSTTNAAQSIQASASAMMSFYSKGAETAVTEWRNALRSRKSSSDLLSLLYVANEVLQTSKRNRGNKFLQAFGPVLKSSLVFICEEDRGLTEKVRRTVKIWGDRHVFSLRFVTEILGALESFRSLQKSTSAEKTAPKPIQTQKSSSDSEDEEDSHFLQKNKPSLLQIDIDIDTHAVKTKTELRPTAALKRKRSPEHNQPPSPSTLLSLLQTTQRLHNQYSSIHNHLPHTQAPSNRNLHDIYGDELQQLNHRISQKRSTLKRQEYQMHSIAEQLHKLEKGAHKYIPLLKDSIQTDKDEMLSCDRLQNKLRLLQLIIDAARKARDKKRQKEAIRKQQEEKLQKDREQEEERKKSLESIVQAKGEVKPGMVWNAAAREYQYCNDPTQDSWRD